MCASRRLPPRRESTRDATHAPPDSVAPAAATTSRLETCLKIMCGPRKNGRSSLSRSPPHVEARICRQFGGRARLHHGGVAGASRQARRRLARSLLSPCRASGTSGPVPITTSGDAAMNLKYLLLSALLGGLRLVSSGVPCITRSSPSTRIPCPSSRTRARYRSTSQSTPAAMACSIRRKACWPRSA